ncbi:MAG: hypothetical protein J7L95_03050 [Prolixibacteraceae bacterium]|nr:hypothetical protein [Prolixibacteraceae bacterium]
MIKVYLSLSLLLLWNLTAVSQTNKKKGNSNPGFHLSLQLGTSSLVTELPNSLSGAIHEFNNQPGLSYRLGFSKYLSNHWEAGFEFSLSVLKGKNNSPNFSAIGFHASMPDPIDEPVIYRNRLLNQKIFVRYFFNSIYDGIQNYSFAPFLTAGVGNLLYKSELEYKNQDGDNLIFGKGVANYKKANTTSAVYFLGTGLKTALSSKMEIMAMFNLNFVNYDFLDVVHNYDAVGTRIELIGIYSDFMVGLSWKIEKKKKNHKKLSKHTKKNIPYLPWYKRR